MKYKTLISQEMLKKGYLASTNCYLCIEHTDSKIKEYIEALDSVFLTIAKCEDGMSINNILEGPIAHSGFERLN